MHWMCCCCFDQSLLLRRFSLNFPLEQLKIPKFSRLRRKPPPARYARRQGLGQLDYPDRHHHASPPRTPSRRPGAAVTLAVAAVTLARVRPR